MSQTQAELRLGRLIEERDQTHKLHEAKLEDVGEETVLDEADTATIAAFRERMTSLDTEIEELTKTVEADNRAREQSKKIKRALRGAGDVAEDDGEVVYRTMAAYARDVILTGNGRTVASIQRQLGDNTEIEKARARLELLKRTPANTLSSDVAGLIPPQHISQIFQVIDESRPIVQSAQRDELVRGTLTYPRVDTSPVVAVQSAEKTEAGNTGMDISMQTATASVYLGGGDLSWQAINWSTPNALDMWFRLCGADYALKTEQDAGQVISHSAFTNKITSTIGATPTFADFMTAVGAGGGEVYAESGRMANTVYLAPDRWWYVFGLTSAAQSMFTRVDVQGVGPLNFVASRGLDSGVVIVGDSDGLLVAETAGAPVELRVVEPAIGGVEVGVIGGFEAVVVDEGAFSMITTAS